MWTKQNKLILVLYYTNSQQSSFFLQAVRSLYSSSPRHHKKCFSFMTHSTWVKVRLWARCTRWTVLYGTVTLGFSQWGLTFFGCLVLAVFIGAGSPGTPWRHLTLNWTADVAELGGVRGDTQTQIIVHWSQFFRDTNKCQWHTAGYIVKNHDSKMK